MVTGAQIKPLRPPPTVKIPYIQTMLNRDHFNLSMIYLPPRQTLLVSGSAEFPKYPLVLVVSSLALFSSYFLLSDVGFLVLYSK